MNHKLPLLIVLGVLSLGIVTSTYAQEDPQDEPAFCTMEARQCPDGSYVGRVGPRCEFAPCPRASSTRPLENSRPVEEAKKRMENARQEAERRQELMKTPGLERRSSATERWNASNTKALNEERKAERRTEFQRESAKRKIENAGRVLGATIERLEKIADRVESRIEKMAERGGDTSEAESYLAKARADLAGAKSAIGGFSSVDLSGETAQDNFQRVREAAAGIREYIRSAHHNLSLAVKPLKGSAATVKSEESPTEEN